MRITHRRKKEEPKKNYLFNEGIVAPEVLVLNREGANLGVMKTGAAIALAREQGLDLVEINPKITPPVTKIIDFGQFRYIQEKEARIAKAHQHVVEIKGVRLSARIGEHDLEIRKNQAMKFLNEGHKVKVEVILRGRELAHANVAFDIIKNFIQSVNSELPVRTEQPTERSANKITAIIAKS